MNNCFVNWLHYIIESKIVCMAGVTTQCNLVSGNHRFQKFPVWNNRSDVWYTIWLEGLNNLARKFCKQFSSASCKLKQRDQPTTVLLPYWRVNCLFITFHSIFFRYIQIVFKITAFLKNIPKCWGNSRIFFVTGSLLVIKYRVKSGKGTCKSKKGQSYLLNKFQMNFLLP